MTTVFLALCALLALGLGARPASAQGKADTDKPRSNNAEIRLGMSADFTASARALGIELYRGAMAYLLPLNEAGGVNGRPVLIRAYDDRYDPDLAVRNTLKFMDRDDGFGRIFWGALSERLGRINSFRLLLASQLVVFGLLMTERNPWVFAALVCYVLSCFGGGFAIMPSLVIDVYGQKRMSRVYGIILTAWSAAGILGPFVVARLKDAYPDRAIIYSLLMGILVLGVGFTFSFLVNQDRFIPRRILMQVFMRPSD